VRVRHAAFAMRKSAQESVDVEMVTAMSGHHLGD
jgi:hypothetical protein